MAEKLRRIKREQPFLERKWKHFFLVCVVLLVVFAVAIGAWSFVGRWRKTHNQAAATFDQKDLMAVICHESGCFWLNKSGRAFYQGANFSGSLVLTLADKTSRELKVNAELLPAQILGELLFLKDRLRGDLGVNVERAEVSDPKLQDLDFVTVAGWTLRFSIAENAYKTLETLKKTLAQIGPANISRLDYIDLRVPNKVYYKLK